MGQLQFLCRGNADFYRRSIYLQKSIFFLSPLNLHYQKSPIFFLHQEFKKRTNMKQSLCLALASMKVNTLDARQVVRTMNPKKVYTISDYQSDVHAFTYNDDKQAYEWRVRAANRDLGERGLQLDTLKPCKDKIQVHLDDQGQDWYIDSTSEEDPRIWMAIKINGDNSFVATSTLVQEWKETCGK